METIEQGLRRIFKNAPHIYAECVMCAKERPDLNWDIEDRHPISSSHRWRVGPFNDINYDYWYELNIKVNVGEPIGPDYPLPPDSPIRQKEVGNWYKCIDGASMRFNTGKWYKCIGPTNKICAFIDNKGDENGWAGCNHECFDLSNPLPHNPETKPTLEEIETKHEQAPEPTQKTEIRLDREKFSFTRNGCLIELNIYYNNRDYKLLYHNEATQDNHETLLELQLEAVRFAKKRLSDISGNYSNN